MNDITDNFSSYKSEVAFSAYILFDGWSNIPSFGTMILPAPRLSGLSCTIIFMTGGMTGSQLKPRAPLRIAQLDSWGFVLEFLK